MVVFDPLCIERLQDEFTTIAFDLFRNGRRSESPFVCDRRIRAWCGCSTMVIAKAWDVLFRGGLPEHATQERLLWAFCFLKTYDTEENNAAQVGGVDEGTF